MTIKYLLFTLLLANTLKSHTTPNTLYDILEATSTEQEDKIPARVKNLLDGQKDKFKQIEHYYLWTSSFDLTSSLFYALAVSIPFFALIFMTCQMTFFDKNYSIIARFGSFMAALFFLCCIFVIFWMTKDRYERSINPGCFCLTDTGLLLIPPSAGRECVWIPYQAIKLIKKIIAGEDGLEQALAKQHLKNRLKRLVCSLDQINKKQVVDQALISQEDRPSTYEENSSFLFIVFKGESKYCTNTYCDSKEMQSIQDYEELCEHLQRKVKPYSVKITTYLLST